MDIKKIYSQLVSQFPNIEIHQNSPLAPYTTVKIGGPADIFIHTKLINDFKNILKFICELPSTTYPTIFGNGSNVLISDTGIRGIVIKNSASEIEILPKNKIKVASGVQLPQLINYSLDHNLVGLEQFSYIPSSIGGAIFGNIHGFDKNDFSEFLDSIEIFDLNTATIHNLPSNKLIWSYDYSSLQGQPNLIVTSAIINLQKGDTKVAKSRAQEITQKKITFQPMKSLGSVFKNPPEAMCLPIWNEKKPAGWIIDNELKLKGQTIGDAQISSLHANFIVNNGHCTANDYLSLINLVQSQMKAKFNWHFELEIKLLGNF